MFENIEADMLTSFNCSMKQFRRSRFWLPGAVRYVSRKCRLLWIIGPGIDASWKFPTRKSQSRIPVANGSARYVYESILPRARLVYLEIIPHNAATGLEEIYRRNVPRNKCTSVKNVEAKFHKKMLGKIRLCAHRCSITTLDTKSRQETAFKSLVFQKCLPNKFKFCYANKRDMSSFFTLILTLSEIRYKIPTYCLIVSGSWSFLIMLYISCRKMRW